MADPSKNDVATKNDLDNLKKELVGILVSKEEFNEQSDRLVTKEEFRQGFAKLVTKEEFRQELEKLVTKEEFRRELAKLVTKEEFRQELAKLATRKSVEVLANQVLKNTNDISEIKVRLNDIDWKIGDIREEIKMKFDAILSAVDNLSRKFDDDRTEKAAIDHALTRHDDRLDSHEVRIAHLERQIA
ncbi:MAG: hypothetical protein MUC94_16095 [bacterium]|jgi:hypothetical protein|nr:hypothetical protein [bacterium]